MNLIRRNWNYYKPMIKAGVVIWFAFVIWFGLMFGMALLTVPIHSVAGAWGVIPYVTVIIPVFFVSIAVGAETLEDYYEENK